MLEVNVNLKRLHPNAVLPEYAKEDDGAMDVTAVEKIIDGKFIEYKTGWALEIPKGYVCLIFSRSSVTKKDLMLKNGVGVLDGGYRGELVLRFNRFGKDDYEVGDKVGQIMVIPRPYMQMKEVSELSDSERGVGGFGSTGR